MEEDAKNLLLTSSIGNFLYKQFGQEYYHKNNQIDEQDDDCIASEQILKIIEAQEELEKTDMPELSHNFNQHIFCNTTSIA